MTCKSLTRRRGKKYIDYIPSSGINPTPKDFVIVSKFLTILYRDYVMSYKKSLDQAHCLIPDTTEFTLNKYILAPLSTMNSLAEDLTNKKKT